jgi:hypothetical protein
VVLGSGCQGPDDLRSRCQAPDPRHLGCVLATAGLLLAVAPLALADSDCQLAFERWTKQSSTYLRVVPQSHSQGRGACVPNEAVRKELLDGLARTRTVCAASATSENLAQTRTLLSINQGFISSLGVCDSDAAVGGAGWATKSAPAPERPVLVAPSPDPPRPVVVAPTPAPPKPVVVAPPPAPPKSVAAVPPPTPPCLEIAPASEDQYALVNRRCRGHTVLAVIESRSGEGETVCRGYTITQSVAVRTAKNTPPRVNHECVTGLGTCNKERLGSIFPECDW